MKLQAGSLAEENGTTGLGGTKEHSEAKGPRREAGFGKSVQGPFLHLCILLAPPTNHA
jgi:hypothetical protein